MLREETSRAGRWTIGGGDGRSLPIAATRPRGFRRTGRRRNEERQGRIRARAKERFENSHDYHRLSAALSLSLSLSLDSFERYGLCVPLRNCCWRRQRHYLDASQRCALAIIPSHPVRPELRVPAPCSSDEAVLLKCGRFLATLRDQRDARSLLGAVSLREWPYFSMLIIP